MLKKMNKRKFVEKNFADIGYDAQCAKPTLTAVKKFPFSKWW